MTSEIVSSDSDQSPTHDKLQRFRTVALWLGIVSLVTYPFLLVVARIVSFFMGDIRTYGVLLYTDPISVAGLYIWSVGVPLSVALLFISLVVSAVIKRPSDNQMVNWLIAAGWLILGTACTVVAAIGGQIVLFLVAGVLNLLLWGRS